MEYVVVGCFLLVGFVGLAVAHKTRKSREAKRVAQAARVVDHPLPTSLDADEVTRDAFGGS